MELDVLNYIIETYEDTIERLIKTGIGNKTEFNTVITERLILNIAHRMNQLKAKRVYHTRGTNRDSILQSKAEGRTYKQINIDGQKFFVRLFTKQNRKES